MLLAHLLAYVELCRPPERSRHAYCAISSFVPHRPSIYDELPRAGPREGYVPPYVLGAWGDDVRLFDHFIALAICGYGKVGFRHVKLRYCFPVEVCYAGVELYADTELLCSCVGRLVPDEDVVPGESLLAAITWCHGSTLVWGHHVWTIWRGMLSGIDKPSGGSIVLTSGIEPGIVFHYDLAREVRSLDLRPT
ncbi:uncharacterized protein B0I36DRAFT_61418 [Microdochium trichocladiopsis]|uniref:Uncharacterized protein n=1 Tax=Microdochium trichocladiopsis TaxID=1682393 RepID=A0A9P9BXH5_9PEZI|nr:uncharacterized protein B0I36DRAFT_61418 [Microdochium trichocladiopsis]KAH7037048.1 hypothetical protein B0I36DRAFT_61418 [Microdochium trichocladiopsis]